MASASIDFATLDDDQVASAPTKNFSRKRSRDSEEEPTMSLIAQPYTTWSDKEVNGAIPIGTPAGFVGVIVNATLKSRDIIPTNGEDMRKKKNIFTVEGLPDLVTTTFNPGQDNRKKYTSLECVPGGQVVCNYGIAMCPAMHAAAIRMCEAAASASGMVFKNLMGEHKGPSTVVLRDWKVQVNEEETTMLALCDALQFHWCKPYLKTRFRSFTEGSMCHKLTDQTFVMYYVDLEDEDEFTDILVKLGYQVKRA
ncbi:hypothetical protein CYMTET_48167 [Cymbomonas tetramitiformis]|uniref:Uncharacterized protein n=1 Tax=Cymbomonas tetramitiformis TaxID=36881 RepID=A0AAE0BUL7_9CHLO|nr:hypothetical protein CYMTET_48167 [Cymbomonas tetramitiformis]